MKIFILPLVIAMFAAPAFALNSPLVFKTLKSESSTALECHFEFKSARTREAFLGRIRVTSVGQVFFAVQRNDELPSECDYALRSLNLGEDTADGSLTINALRTKMCKPALSNEMRKRLDEALDLKIAPAEEFDHPRKPLAQVGAIYVEGFRPCETTLFNKASLSTLQTRLAARPRFQRPAVLPEPLDVSEAMAVVKRNSLAR